MRKYATVDLRKAGSDFPTIKVPIANGRLTASVISRIIKKASSLPRAKLTN